MAKKGSLSRRGLSKGKKSRVMKSLMGGFRRGGGPEEDEAAEAKRLADAAAADARGKVNDAEPDMVTALETLLGADNVELNAYFAAKAAVLATPETEDVSAKKIALKAPALALKGVVLNTGKADEVNVYVNILDTDANFSPPESSSGMGGGRRKSKRRKTRRRKTRR